jgi:hypothetical protein
LTTGGDITSTVASLIGCAFSAFTVPVMMSAALAGMAGCPSRCACMNVARSLAVEAM